MTSRLAVTALRYHPDVEHIEPDEPQDWLAKARAFARPKVVGEGWTDADIDRIIEEERDAAQPRLG